MKNECKVRYNSRVLPDVVKTPVIYPLAGVLLNSGNKICLGGTNRAYDAGTKSPLLVKLYKDYNDDGILVSTLPNMYNPMTNSS